MKKWIATIVFVLLVALDQVTKYIAKTDLQGKEGVSLIKGVLDFQYLEGGNTGAAFGIFQGKTIWLGVVSLVVFLVLVGAFIYLSKEEKNKWICWCLVIMAAGAIGNCIDRFAYRYVIDFIYFKIINFPIFNVADCYVTLSAIALFLLIAFSREDKTEQAQEVNNG